MKINKGILKLFYVTCFALAFLCIFNLPSKTASAAAVTGFVPGEIMDDAVFTAHSTMNVSQIQAFLNSKVINCDTNGTQISEFGGGTRAQWGIAHGYPPPYTCLKDYSENGLSAAQIIYNTAQQYKINPQVFIVLLQKEQALITDTWPLSNQYKTATGYGCPDTAPCDSQYFGLTNQLDWSGKMFRAIMNTSPTWYSPYSLGKNFIQWNPSASCGGSIVNIVNRSTVALYNYTPYQPNQAALNAGYGLGDSCSSYGNRNFYQYFTDWFGSTKIYDPYGWSVIKTADSADAYLVVGNTKRWIPSGEIYNDWNLGVTAVETVSQQYFDSIPTIPPLERLGYYNNRYYYIDGGKKYWLSNESLIKAWGQADKLAIAAPAYIPLSTIPDGGEATFYVSQPSESKVGRLINGQLYLINTNDADRWHANPTILTSAAFNSISVSASLDYHISVNGIKYLVDDGRLLNINSEALLRDYSQLSNTFIPVPGDILHYLPVQDASPLITISRSGAWYILRGGMRYYLPTGDHAKAWGIQASTPTVISDKLASGLHPSSPVILPVVASDSSNGKTYLLDGTKHELLGVMLDAAKTDDTAPPAFSSEYLNAIPTGTPISSPIIRARESGDVFTLDNGTLYYIQNGEILNGLGYPRKYPIVDVSKIFTNTFKGTIKNQSMFVSIDGVTYFMQDGNIFPIDSNTVNDWIGNKIVPIYSSSGLTNRFDFHPSVTLGNFAQEGSDKYLISDGSAYYLGKYAASYLPSGASWKPIALFGMPRSSIETTLVRSTDSNNSDHIFLINGGMKQHILSGNAYSTFSKQDKLRVARLSQSVLDLYSQINYGRDPSPLIYSNEQGYKLLLADGRYLSFPDGETLVHYIQGNAAVNMDYSSYANYSQSAGNLSRLIQDPSGKVYWVENGKKRWITNGNAYNTYKGTPLKNVSWLITDWLPEGNPIN